MEVTTQRARLRQPDLLHNHHHHHHHHSPHAHAQQLAQHSSPHYCPQQHHLALPHSHLCSSTTADSMDMTNTSRTTDTAAVHHNTPVTRGRQRRRSPMPFAAVPFPLQMTSTATGEDDLHTAYSYYTTASRPSTLRCDTPPGGSGTFRGRRRHRSPSTFSSRSTSVASVRSPSLTLSPGRSRDLSRAREREPALSPRRCSHETLTPHSREPSTASAWHRAALGRAAMEASERTERKTTSSKRKQNPARTLRQRNRCPSRSVSVGSRVPETADTDAIDINDLAARVLNSLGYGGQRRRRQRTRSRPRTHQQYRVVCNKDGATSSVVEEECLDDDGGGDNDNGDNDDNGNDTGTTTKANLPNESESVQKSRDGEYEVKRMK